MRFLPPVFNVIFLNYERNTDIKNKLIFLNVINEIGVCQTNSLYNIDIYRTETNRIRKQILEHNYKSRVQGQTLKLKPVWFIDI
jgi:queuine/archaeosine tRNA-ribosyltransferase